jgi:thioredoxin-related protein
MKKIIGLIFLTIPFIVGSQYISVQKARVAVDNTVVAPAEDKITWYTLKEAIAAQQQNPKKILVDVYTDWCGPCKMMMKNTFTNPVIIAYVNEHYYPVKFNAEGPTPVTWKGVEYTNPTHDPNKTGRNGTHQLTYQLATVNGRVAYPTLVYIDEELNILTPVQGYHTPYQLEPIITFFGDDHHKTTQYDEFVKTFESQIGS